MMSKPITARLLDQAERGELPGLPPTGTRVRVVGSELCPSVTGVVQRHYVGQDNDDETLWNRDDAALSVTVDAPIPAWFPYSGGTFTPLASNCTVIEWPASNTQLTRRDRP